MKYYLIGVIPFTPPIGARAWVGSDSIMGYIPITRSIIAIGLDR